MTYPFDEITARLQAERDALPATWNCDRHGDYCTTTDEGRLTQRECPECRIEADAALSAWRTSWRDWRRWQAAGVPGRYQARTLANWKPRTTADHKVLVAVRQWFGQLDAGDLGALVLSGPVGLGKTHLGVALIVEAIKAGSTARYAAVQTLLPALRATFDRDSDTRPDDLLQPLRDADVLVLDEIAGTRGTTWEQDTLGGLIAERYDNGGALILTTNASPAELPQWIGERAADRLAEFGLTLTLAGQSYRARAATDADLRDAVPAFEKPTPKLTTTITTRGEPVETDHYQRGPRGEF